MSVTIAPGATSISLTMGLIDPATNGPLTGETITNLDLTYCRPGAAAVKADATALAAVDSAWDDNKAIEIDSTNAKGEYRVDWPNAAFAAGVPMVTLIVQDASGNQVGRLDVTLDALEVDLVKIHGTALTETAGQLAGAFVKFFNVSTPTGTINSIPDAVAGATGGLFIAGTNAETTITTALNSNIIGNITGNLSGSVGSLTGHTVQTGDTYALANGATGFAALKAETALIAADTNELQTDWANGGRLDLILDAKVTLGMGPTERTYTVTVDGSPEADVLVELSTDAEKTNVICEDRSDAAGEVKLSPDLSSGTSVYLWRQKTGVTFVNPDVEVIP